MHQERNQDVLRAISSAHAVQIGAGEAEIGAPSISLIWESWFQSRGSHRVAKHTFSTTPIVLHEWTGQSWAGCKASEGVAVPQGSSPSSRLNPVAMKS
jgi:hypothetical protein